MSDIDAEARALLNDVEYAEWQTYQEWLATANLDDTP